VVRLSWPRQLPVRAYGEIVEELAATPHPDVARDPDESLAVLERLIREARAAVKAARRRGASTASFKRPVTPEEIVGRIARMTDPYKSSEPFDSEQTLARLIHECRGALSRRRRRNQARLYARQSQEFTRAMLRIEDASAEELRGFARDVVDLLWGEGAASSKQEPRRLDFDKEWEGDTIEEVAFALSRSGFHPFPRPGQSERDASKRPTCRSSTLRRPSTTKSRSP